SPAPPPAPCAPYTLPLHDALPIYKRASQHCEARFRISIVVFLFGLFGLWLVRIHKVALFGCGRFQFALDKIHERAKDDGARGNRSEEHTSELQSRFDLVCRLLLEK